MDYQFDMVSMKDEVKCTSGVNALIGTQGIASCIGVLLYDSLNKKAIVGHYVSNIFDGFEYEDALRIYHSLKNTMHENNFSNDLYYYIVPGIVGNVDRINKVTSYLEEYLSPINKFENIDSSSIKMNKETESLEFVFDATHGNFITKEFYPNDLDYSYEKEKSI